MSRITSIQKKVWGLENSLTAFAHPSSHPHGWEWTVSRPQSHLRACWYLPCPISSYLLRSCVPKKVKNSAGTTEIVSACWRLGLGHLCIALQMTGCCSSKWPAELSSRSEFPLAYKSLVSCSSPMADMQKWRVEVNRIWVMQCFLEYNKQDDLRGTQMNACIFILTIMCKNI